MRDFTGLGMQLARAGYSVDHAAPFFGPSLFRACREFQQDRGLPASGIPDEATLDALTAFLERMRSYDEAPADVAP